MSFVYPNFLWALGVLIIPILVHLFNFKRYKTIYFSKVDYLNEVIEDTKSGLKLKHLLILLSRFLALTALVLAFAQPFIPIGNSKKTENVTSIYIDNTFSMQSIGKDGDLLNESKNKAIELVKSLDENQKINLLTSDLLGTDQRFYSKNEIIERIKQIQFTAQTTPLNTVISLQSDLIKSFQNESNAQIVLFSDFQKSTTDLSGLDSLKSEVFAYQSLAQNQENIYIDSVWFESPVQKENSSSEVYFRVQNQTEKSIENLDISLKLNGVDKGKKNLSIPPHSFVEDHMSFTNPKSGVQQGQLHIETTQIYFDDDFYFTYHINNQVQILLIEGELPSDNLSKLYQLDDFYQLKKTSIRQIKQSDFENQQLIILQNINGISSGLKDLLDQSIKNGATVVVIPSDQPQLNEINSFLNPYQLPTLSPLTQSTFELSYFNDVDPLYNGVFEKKPENYKYAKVFQNYPFNTHSNQQFIRLFGQGSTKAFLIYSKASNGRIFIQNSPLNKDFTDFEKHALFAATYLRIAETSALNTPFYFTIGEDTPYPLRTQISESAPFHLTQTETSFDVIPPLINGRYQRQIQFSNIYPDLKMAGIYTLSNENNFNDLLAFNYSRTESNIEHFSQDELNILFEEQTKTKLNWLNNYDKGHIEISKLKAKEYWRILLILALVFLITEILIIKFWRT